MIDPAFELERLRQILITKGLSYEQIESISKRASADISEAITNAIASALDTATQAGVDAKADRFISELRAIYFGSTFVIATDSGQTDFSEPPFPMLGRLLKNPKVSKDGTLYKVIPIGGRSGGTTTDLISAQKGIEAARIQANNHSGDPVSAGIAFSGAFAAQKANDRNNTIRANKANRGSRDGVKFRTATSKQDPTKQWVHPGKDKDMTATLQEINRDLAKVIENSVAGIIQSYTEGAR